MGKEPWRGIITFMGTGKNGNKKYGKYMPKPQFDFTYTISNYIF